MNKDCPQRAIIANLSFQTASSAMELLITHGIAREITGKRRGRLFVYDQYLSILNEGTQAEADT